MGIAGMSVKLFADGADLEVIKEMAALPYIRGFTTNPTLMRKAGVSDYELWARRALELVQDRPFSFEVLSDEPVQMIRQAAKLASWGENVYVKIPAVNTRNETTLEVVRTLVRAGIKVNVTALMSDLRARPFIDALTFYRVPGYISIFAGRIADTGQDPRSHILNTVHYIRNVQAQDVEVIWASPRQLYDVVQAEKCGCQIITATKDILSKLPLIGKDLDEYSHETSTMFFKDAQAQGYTL